MPRTLLLIFLIAMPPTLRAQDAGGGKSGGVQLRGFAFSLFEGIDKLELRDGKKSVGELALPTGQLRPRTPVSSRRFAFGVTQGDTFRPLGKVALPAAGKDFIIVFSPTATGYAAFPVRADDPDFRGDDTYLFNFTNRRLGILLGTARQTVAPGKSARLRPSFPADATFYKAMFAYEKDGEFVPFNNTRWPANPNTKALLFVFEDPQTGRVAYRSVTELAAGKPPQEE